MEEFTPSQRSFLGRIAMYQIDTLGEIIQAVPDKNEREDLADYVCKIINRQDYIPDSH